MKGEESKIELVSCLNGGAYCQGHLDIINKRFTASNQYVRNKEYSKSIEELISAFDETSELSESSCSRCAAFFRDTITRSLENIQVDLSRMSHGFFRQRYEIPYQLATNKLEELKRRQ